MRQRILFSILCSDTTSDGSGSYDGQAIKSLNTTKGTIICHFFSFLKKNLYLANEGSGNDTKI